MTDLVALCGTNQPPAPLRTIRHGDVTLVLQSGAIRHIRVAGVEIIRGVAFLVRDRDWGTIQPDLGELAEQNGSDLRLTLPMRFVTPDARLDVTLSIVIGASGITISATGQVTGDLETNRAGFTVLHPIEGVAGAPAIVTHDDSNREDGRFPLLIEPWQPFNNIAALEHRANGMAVRVDFTGDVFEMEDQRQWGDASYKTYNRPLALPWPYLLADGEELSQSVAISWAKFDDTAAAEQDASPTDARFPQMALVLTADDAAASDAADSIRLVNPQRLLCHIDATLGPVAEQAQAFAGLQAALPDTAFDLELICRFDNAQPPEQELQDDAQAIAGSGLRPASIFVCPSVDRQSTPPGSDWPDCPPLDRVHQAVASAFPGLPHGGGMASFFPELNRKRPPVNLLDFVTHGLCPIVHAADDLSVIETLQAVPHIARSARKIAAGREYRIGPATIAMRQNPYGSRTIPNPDGGRVCMTDDDPRHRAAFGAAYALGLATALAPFDVAVWTPAAVLGPRGLSASYPLTKLLAQLAALAGQPVNRAEIRDGIALLQLGEVTLRANLTADQNDGLAPYDWQSFKEL